VCNTISSMILAMLEFERYAITQDSESLARSRVDHVGISIAIYPLV
jgi:hypothetical protein